VAIAAQLGRPLTAAEVVDRSIGRSHASIAEIFAARLGADLGGPARS
jgi:hypothetical protein